ncbi:hypothetical protein [Nafulsella turpanensis]|uniref:hypothetical protein n=1 Tax=Nafulsella turpanensis TaxID=1265690 RepID=UPI000349E9D9|nr:hypothetical protein [Nafulsella turpanensis]
MKKGSYFWIGFSDLMTSLFFIMLVMYVITFAYLKFGEGTIESITRERDDLAGRLTDLMKERDALKAQMDGMEGEILKLVNEVDKFNEIKNVEAALSTLDEKYYSFDPDNKRYKLNIDVQFPSNKSDIKKLPAKERDQLKKAGRELYGKVSKLVNENKEIEYLLVIEGNTQRSGDNWKRIPNVGYMLSYERALALFNFWKANGIDFNQLNGQCEVIIAGSGYFGQSREAFEPNNRRFSIQVTSKVGKFLNK